MADPIWVNEDRTVLVTRINDDTVHVAQRDTTEHTWGPPVECQLEKEAE